MSGIGGCRSSGAITADKLIYTGSGKLISIHGLGVAPNSASVKIYDNTSASGTVIGVLSVGPPNPESTEADLHGVIFKNGLYADVTHVGGTTGTIFTVEFN
tara:strand:+ start:449 stop:751 length:303 start_codon:yes stop_codon:yes gene_type:complete